MTKNKKQSKASPPRTAPSWMNPGIFKHVGREPGSLVYDSTVVANGEISVIRYTPDSQEMRVCESIDDACAQDDPGHVRWVNINALTTPELLTTIGKRFSLEPMTLADILDVHQLPKFEDLGHCCLMIIKMIKYDATALRTDIEQITLILGQGIVVTVQERPGDVFGAIRDRIANGKGRIRTMGADYLFYSLIDAIVDNYFTALEALGDRMTAAEDAMLSKPDENALRMIHTLRRGASRMRRSISPLRDILPPLERGDPDVISDAMSPYFRDVRSHVTQLLDILETSREMLASLHDMYLSLASNRMNEVMKVLTVFAAIFIPLTFVAGVYGMNFEVMPELHWHNGYFIIWIVMLSIALTMLVVFRKRRWL